MAIRLLDRGTIDEHDSAFPQVAMLGDGGLLCTFSDAGGQFATGGTGMARSTDGRRWEPAGTLLPASADPVATNFLKPSRSSVTGTVFAYGSRSSQPPGVVFDDRRYEAIVCRSTDDGRTWSTPVAVPFPTAALEVSHGILPLPSGRLLAPTATTEPGALGAQVLVAISDDDGLTWPRHVVAMEDPERQCGFLEQKLTLLPDGRILATAWTVTLDDVTDRPNHWSISADDGETWTDPAPMPVHGQTLSAVPLGGDRLVLLYNRRYGEQGIVAVVARLNPYGDWDLGDEVLVHDAAASRSGRQADTLADEMLDFKFGFPTGILLPDRTVLVTFWSVEDDICGVRWAVLASP